MKTRTTTKAASGSALSKTGAATKLKRPRTKAFLERSSYHHSVQRSCAFLEREVELLCANDSESCNISSTNNTHADEALRIQQQQQQQGGDSTNLRSLPSLSLPMIRRQAAPHVRDEGSRGGDIRLIAQSVIKHRRRSKQDYISYRDALKIEAQTNIQLFESFQCITKSVNMRSCITTKADESSMACPLLKLNQGIETTQGIKSMISQFAGVPTKIDVEDWKELASYIAIDETL